LVLEWLENLGGIPGMEAIKGKKAGMLYNVLDNSNLFKCPALVGSRSDMNVVFRTESEELDDKFVKAATAAGFTNLKGHRNVGGMRASIYNAMPMDGVEKLCDFIREFEKNN
jgi:phosphoserine aminotransferase